MKLFKQIRFRVWRWHFLRFRLQRIIDQASKELADGYNDHLAACQEEGVEAMPFHEWCTYYLNAKEMH